jgi:hypothetical protein
MQTKELLSNFPLLVAFSALASFFLFLHGPIDIYLHNSDEFSSNIGELVRIFSLMAGILFVLVVALIFISPRMVRNTIIRVLAFTVLSSWTLSNFLYGNYGRLDGEPLAIEMWSPLALLQTAVLLFLLALVVKLKIENVFKISAVLFLVGLVSSTVVAMSKKTETTQSSPTGFRSTLTEFSSHKNVIHVVLDELSSDLLLRAIESDSEIEDAFDGFTLFSDTLSVYPSTVMSISLLMTGEVYRNSEPKNVFLDKLKKQNKGIERLTTVGYELDSYTSCKLNVVERCTNLRTNIITKDAVQIEALQLLDLFIFKSVPDYLKPAVYNHEQWLLLEMSSHNSYLKFPSGRAHLLFEKYVEDISVSDNISPRYKFFHSMVTHSPASLNADCRIVESEKRANWSKVEFVKCGIGHFTDLLKKLKELEIYDETMIVLSSDHGSNWIDDSVDTRGFKDRGIKLTMVSRASASMAIKPFNSRGAIVMAHVPVSLRDIPQTILAANGLDLNTSAKNSSETRDVFSVSPTEQREREFLFYTWETKYWREEVLPPINTLKINGRIKDPNSWPNLTAINRSSE